MIETYDVGSMPFFGDFKKFSDGSSKFASYPLGIYGNESESSAAYFERKVVNAFIEKLRAGIDIPNYPQFRI